MKSNVLPILLALGLAAPAAIAQTGAPPPDPGSNYGSGYGWTSGGANGMRSEAGADLEAQAEAMPKPHTRGDVSWLCGGVGRDEVTYMNRQAAKYDMKLTFAEQDGPYLADVNVNVLDARGNRVLEARCDGPIMLVDLPRGGRYRVEAEIGGIKQTRNVQVNEKARTAANVTVTWPRQAIARIEEQNRERAATRASGTSMERPMHEAGERGRHDMRGMPGVSDSSRASGSGSSDTSGSRMGMEDGAAPPGSIRHHGPHDGGGMR